MERVATRGRPKGSRGRGKGKRGRKRQVVSDEEENIETNANSEEIQEDPVSENNMTQENIQDIATTETKSPAGEIGVTEGDALISEANHDDEEVIFFIIHPLDLSIISNVSVSART